ncbi:MAG TPA: Maf family protein, partial [Acidimicrobiales bacterium]|nr:Maf family protein [Acidimicrobiales bacterium]
MTRPLVLASGSPARLRLLLDAGIEPEVVVSGADETIDAGLDPAVSTVELARRKANAVAQRLTEHNPAPLVLGCDSMLFFDGATHGKPLTADVATAAWQARRGRSGVLWTGHVLVDLSDGRHVDAACATTVHFAKVTDAEVTAYVAT